jgi:hypothetical protein
MRRWAQARGFGASLASTLALNRLTNTRRRNLEKLAAMRAQISPATSAKGRGGWTRRHLHWMSWAMKPPGTWKARGGGVGSELLAEYERLEAAAAFKDAVR